MGGEARVVLYCATEDAAIEAANSAFDTIAALDSVMSDWSATSEVSQLALSAGRGPVHVSDDLFAILRRACEIAERTDGAFDPTVGPLVALWRRARANRVAPTNAEITAACEFVGVHLLAFDDVAHTVALAKPGMRLDLGAIGKGFACQRAIEALARHGIAIALVQMGGDLVCSNAPPGRAGWAIDLAAARAESKGERILVSNRAVSTSGDREQFVVIDGVRHSHVVDPRTGAALVNEARAIVVARDGATSDALATALGALGPEHGLTMIERFPECEARIECTKSGVLTTRSTPGFSALPREMRHDP